MSLSFCPSSSGFIGAFDRKVQKKRVRQRLPARIPGSWLAWLPAAAVAGQQGPRPLGPKLKVVLAVGRQVLLGPCPPRGVGAWLRRRAQAGQTLLGDPCPTLRLPGALSFMDTSCLLVLLRNILLHEIKYGDLTGRRSPSEVVNRVYAAGNLSEMLTCGSVVDISLSSLRKEGNSC